MKIKHAQHYQRRGVALMLVMITVLVTGGMAVAYFGSRSNSIAISENVQRAAKARMSAETGVELAIAILETDFDWRTQHVDGVILNDFVFGESKFSITITDSDTNLPPTTDASNVELTIRSTVDGVTQEMLARATVIENENEFDVDFSEFAVFANTDIRIQDVSTVQRWAASPGASRDSNVRMGTLSTQPLSIRSTRPLRSVEIHGPKNASSMLSTTRSKVNTFSDTPKLLLAPTPCADSMKALKLDSSKPKKQLKNTWKSRWTQAFTKRIPEYQHSNKQTITEGNYTLNELHLIEGDELYISGDVVLTISETFMIDNADIILDDDATLTIHAESDVEIDSGYIGDANKSIRSWMDPSRVKLYSNEQNDWDIRGDSMIKGEVYAPNAFYEMSEQSTLCGRVAAGEVSLNGASRLYYDQLLDHGGYANPDGLLYDERGEMVSELKRMNNLDSHTISALQDQYAENDDDADYFSGRNWLNTPTKRPNEVVYQFIAYGFDAREWETEACRQSQTRVSTAGNRFKRK